MVRIKPSRQSFVRRKKNRKTGVIKVILWLVAGAWIGSLSYMTILGFFMDDETRNQVMPRIFDRRSEQQALNSQEQQQETSQEPIVIAAEELVKQAEGDGETNKVIIPETLNQPKHDRNDNDPQQQQQPDEPRFLIFQGDQLEGQGAGNLMNGLLATHLLGDEFDRIVCITRKYRGFHAAWRAIHPLAVQHCTTLLLAEDDNKHPKISLVNYNNNKSPIRECHVKELLASTSPQETIIQVEGNTYPRWPHVPPNYFLRFYKPQPVMLDVLPYNPKENPPKTVVHLRKPDGHGDVRYGLDDKTFGALGKMLAMQQHNNNGNDIPYLVTNHVPWFDEFQAKYGWQHPDWQTVPHSGIHHFMRWGNRTTKSGKDVDLAREDLERQVFGKDNTPQAQLENLQLWADWFTLLGATRVFHTASDFSASAVHWMGTSATDGGIQSYVMEGPPGHVDLLPEYWRREDPAIPLVDRTGMQLENCW